MKAIERYRGVPLYVRGALALAVVTAACGDSGPSAPGSAAAAVERTAASTEGQTAYAGDAVPVAPSVVVRDGRGRALGGVSVTFTVTEGGGSVERATATTNLDGIASAGRWTLGTAGPNEVMARVGSLPAVRFTATATATPSPVGAFDIVVRYVSSVTSRQRQAVEAAVLRWRTVIQSDLPNIPVNAAAGSCFPRQPALNETVDDLLLLIDFVSIDGVGKTLGEAGPCYIRTSSGLPVVGYLKLDASDLEYMESTGTIDDVVLHELGHVLGIGTLWDNKSLIAGTGTDDPQFTGTAAVNAYRALGGLAAGVPLENTGGTGTREGHWRETVFTTELMTGWVGQGSNPLSAMTIGSLQDLGYGASTAAASAYTLGGGASRSMAAIDMRERERLTPPRFRIDERGRISALQFENRAF